MAKRKEFDIRFNHALELYLDNDFSRSKMVLGGLETAIKRSKEKDLAALRALRRVQFVYSGLFNKKFRQ